MNKEEQIESLRALEGQLSELEELNKSVAQQTESLKQAERALELYQARIKEETESMIKERRETLQSSLRKEVKLAERRMERAQKRRNQERSKQVKKRISESVAGNQEQIQELKEQIKEMVHEADLPAYCASRMWHKIFMPSSIADVLVLILLATVLSVGLPTIIYFMIPHHQLWHAYILLPLFILLTIYPYLQVLQNTRERHKDVLMACREKFKKIDELSNDIEQITKNISESDDDSAYLLERQDDRLNLARNRMEQARERQSQELSDFESITRADIVKEFQEQSQEKETELQNVIQHLSRERSLTMEMVSELHLKMVEEYEEVVGAENLTIASVRTMLNELEG